MAAGFASTPSSWTESPALPSSSFAMTIDCVVSGQTVVHSESLKARMTTRPRNWLSDIGWPNWLTSLMSGACSPLSELPRSRLGFCMAAWLAAPMAGMPDAADELDDDAQPAAASVAASGQGGERRNPLDHGATLLHRVVIDHSGFALAFPVAFAAAPPVCVPPGSGSGGSSPTITLPPCPQER